MGEAFGSRPADLLVGIGPAIGPCCYRVGPEVVGAFHRAFGDVACAWWRQTERGDLYLDLWEANRWQLAVAGVRYIEVAGLCTADLRHDFFSHRAEGGRTGRFGAIIGLRQSHG